MGDVVVVVLEVVVVVDVVFVLDVVVLVEDVVVVLVVLLVEEVLVDVVVDVPGRHSNRKERRFHSQ